MAYIPSMPEVSFVAQSRGRASAAPHLWHGLVGLWLPNAGVQGGKLFDFSGYANHGTLTSMDVATDWVSSRLGHALNFDGTNQYVDTGHRFAPAAGGFSVAVWVRPTFAWNAGNYYFCGQDEHSYRGWNLLSMVHSSRRKWQFSVQFSTTDLIVTQGSYNSDAAYGRNTWKLLVGIVEPDGTGRLHEDALAPSAGSWAGTYSATSRDTYIGNKSSVYGAPSWPGDLGFTGIWNRVLSSAEIRQLYYDPHCMTRLARIFHRLVGIEV